MKELAGNQLGWPQAILARFFNYTYAATVISDHVGIKIPLNRTRNRYRQKLAVWMGRLRRLTSRSNSSPEVKPSRIASSRKVVPLAWAALADLRRLVVADARRVGADAADAMISKRGRRVCEDSEHAGANHGQRFSPGGRQR